MTCPAEPQVERFGCYGGFERVDQGWLVKDAVVQFRLCSSTLHNDPVMLFKKRHHDKKVRGEGWRERERERERLKVR